MTLFGLSSQALFGQLLLGLINGSFYAVLSLGLAVIFGLLNIINFAHGAQYMVGAFVALLALEYLGMNYWVALLAGAAGGGPAGGGDRARLLRHLYKLDHLYGLLLTFGLALIARGGVQVLLRRLGQLLLPARAAAGRGGPGLHVPAAVPRLGGAGLADGLYRDLVRDRAHPAGRHAARRHREAAAGAGPGHQRAGAGHRHLRRRRRRWRPSPACWPRRCCR
jgi:branched-subunit amino acid ABC-type transport system permease component